MLALLPCFQTGLMADPTEPDSIPIKPVGSQPGPLPGPRLRAPRRGDVSTPECYYYNGEVSIYASDVTYINATVTRMDDNAQWSGYSMDEALSFAVSTEPGVYILTLTLSNGQSYIGEYTVY